MQKNELLDYLLPVLLMKLSLINEVSLNSRSLKPGYSFSRVFRVHRDAVGQGQGPLPAPAAQPLPAALGLAAVFTISI